MKEKEAKETPSAESIIIPFPLTSLTVSSCFIPGAKIGKRQKIRPSRSQDSSEQDHQTTGREEEEEEEEETLSIQST